MAGFYYRGHLLSNHSLAHVARIFLSARAALNDEWALQPDDQQGIIEVPEIVLRRVVHSPPQHAEVALTFQPPPAYASHLIGKRRLAVFNVECEGPLPPGYVETLSQLSCVLPSSTFSEQTLHSNGVTNTRLLPHPVDVDSLLPLRDKARDENRFVVTVVAANHHRKNIDRCITAFLRAFPSERDVILRLRVPPRRRQPAHFEIDTEHVVNDLAARDERVDWQPKTQASLLELYATSNVLLSMSSGEGFGLPMLEALLAGVRVIAPRYSGPTDFLSDHNALLVSAPLRQTPHASQYLSAATMHNNGRDCDPSIEHASSLLRKAYIERTTWRSHPTIRDLASRYHRDKIYEQFQQLLTDPAIS